MNNEKTKIPAGLMAAPGSLAAESLTLIWDKPLDYKNITSYNIYQNEIKIGEASCNKTHFTVNGLSQDTEYRFYIEAFAGYSIWGTTPELIIRTIIKGETIDVTNPPYSADPMGKTLSTVKLQQAIDSCPPGGTVLIPEGAVILTGAVELKSNITLRIDGIIRGSLNPADYTVNEKDRKNYNGQVNEDGLVLTRYEGWELYCYRSLINGGHLNPDNRREVTCENIRICGKGTIIGGGNELGTEMKKIYSDKEKYPEYVSDGIGGRRVRGRLISFIQCRTVHLTGITIENPSCWTVHIIYSDTVTTHGVSIKSRGIDNGDGWDPDSSRNLLIFDTSFDTGDDCIAIKSGKNPEGNIVNIPTENVRIFDLKMLGGNGMAIGSEQSGGVDGIYIRDCIIQNTNYGLELKAQRARGGYIRNIQMSDCCIDRFMAHSVEYNADGISAPELPYFRDIKITDTVISGEGRAVELIGFSPDSDRNKDSKEHFVQNVVLENVLLNGSKEQDIYIESCHNITLKNVRSADGNEPRYIIDMNTVSDVKFI